MGIGKLTHIPKEETEAQGKGSIMPTASEFSNWHLNSSPSDCIVKLSSGCGDLE